MSSSTILWTRPDWVDVLLCQIHNTTQPLPQATEATILAASSDDDITQLINLLKAARTEYNRLSIHRDRLEDEKHMLQNEEEPEGTVERRRLRDAEEEEFVISESYDQRLYEVMELMSDKDGVLESLMEYLELIVETKEAIVALVQEIWTLRGQGPMV